MESPAVTLGLSELRRASLSADDPVLARLFASAEEHAAAWMEGIERLEQCRAAFEDARSHELTARRRVVSAVEALCELDDDGRADRMRVGRWLRGGLHRRRSAVVAEPPPTPAARDPDPRRSPDRAHDEPPVRRAAEPAAAIGVPGGGHATDVDPAERRVPPGRPADVAAYYLGPFHLLVRGQPVDLPADAKGVRVLKYLLAASGRSVPKDVLVDLFWPDADAETGQRNLHQALYSVRKTLRSGDNDVEIVAFDNGGYRVNRDLGVWSDVEEFETQAALGRRVSAAGRRGEALACFLSAERLYAGDYLEDSPYEEWLLGERERLRLLYVDVADSLSGLRFEAGDLHGALEVSQRLLQREPCDETAHRRVMSCYAALGQRHLVVRQYRSCVENLKTAYGLEPSAETVAHLSDLIG